MSGFKEEGEENIPTADEVELITLPPQLSNHPSALEQTAIRKDTKLKWRYDSDLVQEMLSKSKRYKHLKPEALAKIVGERPNYEYLKKIAVAHLEDNLRKQFAIFSQIINKKEDNNETIEENQKLSHGVFSWKWSDFLERRQQSNFVWVDILLRKKEDHLHYLKFQNDIQELQFFLDKIFQGFLLYIENGDANSAKDIATTMDEAQKALDITDNLEKEFDRNAKELEYIVYKEYVFTDARRHSEERMLKAYLENRISNSHIFDPIEIRYQLNWLDSLVKQNQYNVEKTTKELQTDIASYREKENTENFINGSCLDYCYTSIELYKIRINEIQSKYDKEYDDMENKLTILRLEIEKMKEQRNWLTSEIQRFHDEEEQIRLQEEMNAAKEEDESFNLLKQILG